MKQFDLMLGNCLELLPTLENESVDCVCSDVAYPTLRPSTSGYQKEMWKGKKGNGGFKENKTSIQDYLPELWRVMKEAAHGYIFSNEKNLIDFHLAIKAQGFSIYKTLIWDRSNKIPNNCYCNKHEYIIFFRKGKHKQINDTSTPTVLRYQSVQGKIHPSEKPVPLIRKLITNSTQKGEVVLDFMMGSGSAAEACHHSKRRFIGMEMDPKWFGVAKDRVRAFEQQLNLF